MGTLLPELGNWSWAFSCTRNETSGLIYCSRNNTVRLRKWFFVTACSTQGLQMLKNSIMRAIVSLLLHLQIP